MPQPLPFLSSLQEGVPPGWRVAAVNRILGVMTLLLLVATWRLWIPQEVFPQIPLFAGTGHFPREFQWALLIPTMLSLLIGFYLSLFIGPKTEIAYRSLWIVFICCLGLLISIDQHRLQPWAYEAILAFLVLACVKASRALTLLRMLTISIYFYSAVSKLDYSFLHTMGQQFTETLFNLTGLSHWKWPEAMRLLAAFVYPVGELLVGLLLAFAGTRKIGVYAALFMHGVLLLVLGPLGMDQQWAVLIWNVQFMLTAVFLFYGPTKAPEPGKSEMAAVDLDWKNSAQVQVTEIQPPAWISWPVQGVLVLAILLPLLKASGYWDHWLSWDLYSPGTSKAQIFLHTTDVDYLPLTWQNFVHPDAEDPNWVQLRMDLCSLDQLAVPIYPQARFQLGVAAACMDELPPNQDVWIVVSGPANRYTGKRISKVLKNRPQLDAAMEQYWLNARPAEQ